MAPRLIGGGRGLEAAAATARGRALANQVGTGSVLGAGSMYNESVEAGDPSPYAALGLSPLYGLTEAALPAAVGAAFRQGGKVGVRELLASGGGVGKSMLKAGGLGVLGEGATEGIQNEMEMLFNPNLSEEEVASRRLNAVVAGGIVGGPVGSLGGIPRGLQYNREVAALRDEGYIGDTATPTDLLAGYDTRERYNIGAPYMDDARQFDKLRTSMAEDAWETQDLSQPRGEQFRRYATQSELDFGSLAENNITGQPINPYLIGGGGRQISPEGFGDLFDMPPPAPRDPYSEGALPFEQVAAPYGPQPSAASSLQMPVTRVANEGPTQDMFGGPDQAAQAAPTTAIQDGLSRALSVGDFQLAGRIAQTAAKTPEDRNAINSAVMRLQAATADSRGMAFPARVDPLVEELRQAVQKAEATPVASPAAPTPVTPSARKGQITKAMGGKENVSRMQGLIDSATEVWNAAQEKLKQLRKAKKGGVNAIKDDTELKMRLLKQQFDEAKAKQDWGKLMQLMEQASIIDDRLDAKLGGTDRTLRQDISIGRVDELWRRGYMEKADADRIIAKIRDGKAKDVEYEIRDKELEREARPVDLQAKIDRMEANRMEDSGMRTDVAADQFVVKELVGLISRGLDVEINLSKLVNIARYQYSNRTEALAEDLEFGRVDSKETADFADLAVDYLLEKKIINQTQLQLAQRRSKVMDEGAGVDVRGMTAAANRAVEALIARIAETDNESAEGGRPWRVLNRAAKALGFKDTDQRTATEFLLRDIMADLYQEQNKEGGALTLNAMSEKYGGDVMDVVARYMDSSVVTSALRKEFARPDNIINRSKTEANKLVGTLVKALSEETTRSDTVNERRKSLHSRLMDAWEWHARSEEGVARLGFADFVRKLLTSPPATKFYHGTSGKGKKANVTMMAVRNDLITEMKRLGEKQKKAGGSTQNDPRVGKLVKDIIEASGKSAVNSIVEPTVRGEAVISAYPAPTVAPKPAPTKPVSATIVNGIPYRIDFDTETDPVSGELMVTRLTATDLNTNEKDEAFSVNRAMRARAVLGMLSELGVSNASKEYLALKEESDAAITSAVAADRQRSLESVSKNDWDMLGKVDYAQQGAISTVLAVNKGGNVTLSRKGDFVVVTVVSDDKATDYKISKAGKVTQSSRDAASYEKVKKIAPPSEGKLAPGMGEKLGVVDLSSTSAKKVEAVSKAKAAKAESEKTASETIRPLSATASALFDRFIEVGQFLNRATTTGVSRAEAVEMVQKLDIDLKTPSGKNQAIGSLNREDLIKRVKAHQARLEIKLKSGEGAIDANNQTTRTGTRRGEGEKTEGRSAPKTKADVEGVQRATRPGKAKGTTLKSVADTAANPSSVKAFLNVMRDWLGVDSSVGNDAGAVWNKGRVAVYETLRDAPTAVQILFAKDPNTQGIAFEGERAYIIANRVEAGQELGVLLHEVGEHVGLKKFLGGDAKIIHLMAQVERMGAGGTKTEREAVTAAKARIPKDTPAKDYKRELIAYTAEELVKRGITPTTKTGEAFLGSKFLGELMALARRVISEVLGRNPRNLTGEDLLDILQGAAALAVRSPETSVSPIRKMPMRSVARADVALSYLPQRLRSPIAAQLKALFNGALRPLMPMADVIESALRKGMRTAKQFQQAYEKRTEMQRQLNTEAERIGQAYSRLTYPVQELVNKALSISTLKGWGYQPDWLMGDDGAKVNVKINAEAKAAMDAIDAKAKTPQEAEQAREAIDRIFAHNDHLWRLKNYSLNTVIREQYDAEREGVTDKAKLDDIKKREASDLAEHGKRLARTMDRPYASLKRFGDHIVNGWSQEYQDAMEAEDHAKMRELKADPKHFESRRVNWAFQAESQKEELGGKFAYSDSFKAEKIAEQEAYELPYHVLDRLKSQVKELGLNDKNTDSLQRAVSNLYIQMLSQESARKSELQRIGVAGYNEDMVQNFMAQAQADASMLSTMTSNREIYNAMRDMKNEVRTSGKRGELSGLYNEMVERFLNTMHYDGTTWQQKVMRGNSIMQLITSPAYLLSNATQVAMMTVPKLSQYGYTRAWQEVTKAYGDVFKLTEMVAGDNVYNPEQLKKRLYARYAKGKNYDANIESTLAAIEKLQERGKIDITLMQEIGQWAEHGSISKSELINRLKETTLVDKGSHGLRVTMSLPQRVEMVNRMVTGIAAYRLKKDELVKRGDQTAEQIEENATSYAAKVIDESQGAYGEADAGRIFQQGNLPNMPVKLILQFRKFQVIQLAFMVRDMNRFLAREKPANLSEEEWKAEKFAAKQSLQYAVAHYAVMTGALGVPFAMQIAGLLSALTGDDDEPKPSLLAATPLATARDRELTELAVRKWLGGGDFATIVSRGLPNAAGIDLHAKLGAGTAATLLPYAQGGKNAVETSRNVLWSATTGATGGTIEKIARGIDYLSKGDYYKGVAQMLPSGVSNAMKSALTATEGKTDTSGTVLISPDEVSAWNTIVQGAGFTPTMLMEQQLMQGKKMIFTQHYQEERKDIGDRYVKARREGDSSGASAARKEWVELAQSMKKQGLKPPSMDDLNNYWKRESGDQKNVKRGVVADGATRGMVEAGI